MPDLDRERLARLSAMVDEGLVGDPEVMMTALYELRAYAAELGITFEDMLVIFLRMREGTSGLDA